MNEIRRYRSESEEVAEISAIVRRHALPPFVTGFDIELGDVDDEPALWVVFHVNDSSSSDNFTHKSRSETLREMIQSLHPNLLMAAGSRYPYYRFDDVRERSDTP